METFKRAGVTLAPITENARQQLGADQTDSYLQDTAARHAERLHPSYGKAVAIWLYCVGAATLEETQGKFVRHPKWRHA